MNTNQGVVWVGTFVFYSRGKTQCLNQTGISGVIRMHGTRGSASHISFKDPIICFLNDQTHTKSSLELEEL